MIKNTSSCLRDTTLVWYRAGKQFFSYEQGYSDVGVPGWAPERPASKMWNADCGMRIEKEN